MKLIGEGIQEYLTAHPSRNPKVNENMMRTSELKQLVKEVVRQVVKEAGPQYKVRDGRSYDERTGEIMRAREIQEDPVINEKAPPGFSPKGKHGDIRRKVMGQYGKKSPKTYATLNKIAKKVDEAGPQYKVRNGQTQAERPGLVNRSREIQQNPAINDAKLVPENHKVQDRSYRTINDVPQDPENVRDPKVPTP